MSAPDFDTISQIHEAYAHKKATPSEVTRHFLARVKSDTHNAFLTVCAERATAQALAQDAELAKAGTAVLQSRPLFGIPMAIKDNLVMDGVRTTCASKMLENYIPPYTATSVARLEKAGAIALGKTNMDEFAMGGSNENSAFGPVKNPRDPSRIPGGSSGGSAAAVAGNLCVASLGSDTGGSIRLPASFTGVVGLKPTYGSVSRFGLVAFASSLDQIGPLAHNVGDAAAVFAAMSGHDPMDSTSAPGPAFDPKTATSIDWKSVRVGVPREYFSMGGLDPDVEKNVRGAIEWIQKQGAQLVDVSLPHSHHSVAVYYLVAVSEASSNLARFDGVRFGVRPPSADQAKDIQDFYRKVRANFGAEVKRRIILGTFALSAGYADQYYARACQVRRLIKNDFDRAFSACDLIVGPVSPSTAFKLGEKMSDPLKMYLNDIFTIPANLAGLPGISVPLKTSGLPVGLQILGPAFSEARLLSAALSIEKGQVSA